MSGLLLFTLLCGLLDRVSSEYDDCRLHFLCNECVNDISCGWCEELKVCVSGDMNGPYHGECVWNYDTCSTPSPVHDISWYAYGGNQRHNGYVPYTIQITENTEKSVNFHHSISDTTGISIVTAHKDIIYYWSGNQTNLGETYVMSQKLSNADILWSTYIGPNITYCSQPSLSTNIKYLMLQCYIATGTSSKNITIITLNPVDGTIISNSHSFNQKSIATYSTSFLYSPLIAENINMFMMNYNDDRIGDYYIDPYQVNWDISLTSVGSWASLLSAYNPNNKCFYSHTSIPAPTRVGYLTVSQWMNGPVTQFSNNQMYYPYIPKDRVIVMSSNYNMTFITGQHVVSVSTDNNLPPNIIENWYSENEGYFSIPTIDEDEGVVYVYLSSTSNILALNITNGDIIQKYSFGNGLKFTCNWNWGCLRFQPLITKSNIFWTDGSNISIFDKYSGYVVNRINAPCVQSESTQIGMYLTWSNDNLIINCFDSIIAYSFQ